MSALPYLADRLLERPLLATPAHAATVVGVLADRLDVGRITLGGETLDPAAARAPAPAARPAGAPPGGGGLAGRLGVGRITLGGEMLDPAAVRARVQDVARSRAGYVVD